MAQSPLALQFTILKVKAKIPSPDFTKGWNVGTLAVQYQGKKGLRVP
jgi:hypothetical protein